ncbi:MAG: bifunctional DNA-formamidopyrimidine glycosylase/DNA-(apurinic or apyrimidinic site) lyase, partial [Chloroflexi bacterium]|nr:bifunctional DNA-formamidopyrimidine glycosylase/DNA-(apurinic or apyrimidinic site) lyase [Chloroflexota bacterium]
PMPELPEVETIRRGLLEADVLGHRVQEVYLARQWLEEGRQREQPTLPEHVKLEVADSRILRIRRYGKYLLLDLSTGRSLLIHLGMTGVLLVNSHRGFHHNAAAAIFRLDNGSVIFFFDSRRFGDMQVLVDSDDFLRRLGPDPLQSAFTLEQLGRQLSGRKGPIKNVLCDQRVVAGLGNIYSNEVLYQAGIHPLYPASELVQAQVERLYVSINTVLNEAIEQGGTSLSDETYVNPQGSPGGYRPTMYFEGYKVVGKKNGGEVIDCACPTCATAIVRLRMGGRSAFFCPVCQPPAPSVKRKPEPAMRAGASARRKKR